VTGVRRFAGLGDYITINISSPNTPGLRDLQGKEALTRLLTEALDAREAALPVAKNVRSSSRSPLTSTRKASLTRCR
jgi:dihydroorotate dehydrogenase